MDYQDPIFVQFEEQLRMVPSEEVVSGRVIKTFLARRVRSAWHGTRYAYRTYWSFHLWPHDLMATAESHRERGASWRIETVPSLAFASSEHLCCIAHSSVPPYHLRSSLLKPRRTLRELAEEAILGSSLKFLVILARGTYAHTLAEGHSDVWRSVSYGGPPTPLEWRWSSDGPIEIQKEFGEILGDLIKADWPCPGLRSGNFSERPVTVAR